MWWRNQPSTNKKQDLIFWSYWLREDDVSFNVWGYHVIVRCTSRRL